MAVNRTGANRATTWVEAHCDDWSG